jgi:hypothetical protein
MKILNKFILPQCLDNSRLFLFSNRTIFIKHIFDARISNNLNQQSYEKSKYCTYTYKWTIFTKKISEEEFLFYFSTPAYRCSANVLKNER